MDTLRTPRELVALWKKSAQEHDQEAWLAKEVWMALRHRELSDTLKNCADALEKAVEATDSEGPLQGEG